MNRSPVSLRLAFVLAAASVAVLVAATALAMPVRSAPAVLPPRPTPHEEGGKGLTGATIELRVHFDGSQQATHWQELWTVVEWQDALGAWHEVEGWRGTLDEVVTGEGRKIWWVGLGDLSKGPFRWMVYQSRSGGLLAHSEPFNLPGSAGQTTRVSVALGTPEPANADPTPEIEYVWGAGGPAIELRARFDGSQQVTHWQELWTVVEWQDAFGAWHEVEGWRGALDEMVNGEGRKVWWVSLSDLGKGPFRWRVHQGISGRLLAQSAVFHLPDAAGQTVRITVALNP